MSAKPSSAQIGKTQDLEINLRRQLAARTIYKRGKRIYFGGASLALLLALVAPVVLIYQPDLGPLLGAIAGLWVFTSRLFLEPWRLGLQQRGARIQETFDCAVLGLDENEALARPISEEEIRTASRRFAEAEGIKAWYPFPTKCAWPTSVLVCQRSNAVWARRQHRTYALVLLFGAAIWFVVGVVVCIVKEATLAQYLTTIALPSLPAMLDASEMARRHQEAAEARELLENRVDDLLKTPGDVEPLDLREIQDQLYALRTDAPLVPEWFYDLIKDRYESDMQYAADRLSGVKHNGN